MELIDRYLQAVRFWLPTKQKHDIVAELYEDLRSQIEEQEAALGRALDTAEIEALLKKFGQPMIVAQRYLPQRYLIGPNVFPMYWFVLKLDWICVFAPWFVLGVCLDVFVAANRSGHYGALTGVLDHFWAAALGNLVVLTAVFALIERFQPKSGLGGGWNPQRLPKLRDASRISRSSSIGELAWYGVFLLWWVGVFPSLSGLGLAPSPVISRFFFWPILALSLGQTVIACVNVFQPWWTPARAKIRAIVDVLGLLIVTALLGVCFTGGSFVFVSGAQLSLAERAAADLWLTWSWVLLLLVWAEIGFVVRLIQDSRRAAGREPMKGWALQLFAGE